MLSLVTWALTCYWYLIPTKQLRWRVKLPNAASKNYVVCPRHHLPLTMLEQALANVMNLGLNCRQVIGPVCFPSNKATFMPLSAFHTWIFPSSEPDIHGQINKNKYLMKTQLYDGYMMDKLNAFICQKNGVCEAFHRVSIASYCFNMQNVLQHH